MSKRQIKYLAAFLGLVVALFVYTIGSRVALQQAPVSSDSISAFLSVIVISLVITAQSHGTLRQDLISILCVLAGLVAYMAVKSVFTLPPGLHAYLSLTWGAMASAALHCLIHALNQKQST